MTNGEGVLSPQGWYDYSSGYGFNDPSALNYTFAKNQWVHYVFVRSGLTGSYYMNGILKNTTTALSNVSYTNSHLTLGGDFTLSNSGFCTSLSGCFTGVIGQAVVLNKPLVSLEVRSLYLATASNFIGSSPSPAPVLSTPAIIGIATGGAAGVAVLVAVVTVAALYYKGPPRIQDALHKAFKRKPKKEKVQTKKEVDTKRVPAHTDAIKLDIK